MGNVSSRNDEEGSAQQAQPVLHPQSEKALAQTQPRETSYVSNTNDNYNYHTSSSNNNNNNNHKNATKEAKKEAVKLPHNFEAIIKDSDSPIDREKLLEQLQAGVFLNGRKMKYWVNEWNINCFMLFANALKITCDIIGFDIDPKVTWNERTNNFIREGGITTAVIGDTFWVEVQGRFHSAKLTPGVTYEVAYLIELHEHAACGWEDPVNFRLTLPNGTNHQHWQILDQSPRDKWIRILVGEFVASVENFGEIEFSMCEPQGKNWKNGLTVIGVAIEPMI